MKRRMLTPMVAVAVVSLSLFSCAGSSETTAMRSTTMSETQTMAGSAEAENDVDVTDDLSFTDDVDYDDMFENIADTKQYDLISLAKTNPNLSTFVKLVETAEITEALKPDGKYTIFAPTNKAFSTMSREELDRLMKPENKTDLLKVLQLHILPNKVTKARFTDNQRIKAGENRYIHIELDNSASEVSIGGATIVRPDIEASNGVLHVVNGVITTTPVTTR